MIYKDKETTRQDIKCLYDELLKNATKEQKEKAYIAAASYLLACQVHSIGEKSA